MRAAQLLAGVAHGDGGAEGKQRECVSPPAHDERHQHRIAGGRDPASALAAAPGGLLVRGDERAVRRARDRELARTLVRGARDALVQVRRADHARAILISTSGVTDSAVAASPRLMAIATDPNASS